MEERKIKTAHFKRLSGVEAKKSNNEYYVELFCFVF